MTGEDLTVISADQMTVATLENLGLMEAASQPEAHADPGAILSMVQVEAIRAVLWALSADGTESVYVSRLTNAVLRFVEPFQRRVGGREDLAEAGSRAVDGLLGDLEATGDIAVLPSGRRLPTPARCVPLPAIHRWLLLGGVPTGRLPPTVRTGVEHSGVARLLRSHPGDLGLLLATESLLDWTRTPLEPLLSWTQRVLSDPQLTPFDDAEMAFEFYAPTVAQGRYQFERWTPNVTVLPAGRYVGRYRPRFGPATNSVVEVRAGRVVASGPVQLELGDVRRLLYGLDLLAATPVLVRISAASNGFAFELRSELPRAEIRLFTALGRLVVAQNGAYYPRRWEVPTAYAPQAAHALRELGVGLVGPSTVLATLDRAPWD